MDNQQKPQIKNLAYGGQALIEGVLMRSPSGYAFTVMKPDGEFYKEKVEYVSIGKRIKLLGIPFVRGISGFFESMVVGMKVLNKSADIAFPEESGKGQSTISTVLTFLTALLFGMLIFVGLPYYLTQFIHFDDYTNPIAYNLIAGVIRLLFFFIYLYLISFLKETKRLFGYHGAEHKSISTYENKMPLTIENVKKHSRLHPRCGTSFIFIVFIITIIIFPFFNLFFNNQEWYLNLQPIPQSIAAPDYNGEYFNKTKNAEDRAFLKSLYISSDNGFIYDLKSNLSSEEEHRARVVFRKGKYDKLGSILQKIIIILSHILVGMPIVSSISYELLKLSGKYSKNPLIKLFIMPGLLVQLFTTREPDDDMIKAAVLSLKMVTGEEDPLTPRKSSEAIDDTAVYKTAPIINILLMPVKLLTF